MWPKVERRPTFLIRNQTPSRLEIRGKQHTLKLAPLQQVRISYRPHQYLGQAAVLAFTDRAVAWEREPVRSTRVWTTAWLTLIGVMSIGGAIAATILSGPWWLLGAAGIAATLCIAMATALNRPRNTADDDPMAGAVGQPVTGWRFTKDVALTALQKFALLIVLAVGIIGPTAAIYYGSELSDILSVSGRLHVDLVSDETGYPIIVARGLQIVLVVTLALFPGLMYFQFDREKLTTLMDRWVHHAFRLDPTLHTLSDVDAKYGRRVEEFYGASFDSGVATSKKRTTTRSPLYIATLLLALGWVVVLLNTPAELSVQNGILVPDADPAQNLPSIQQFIEPRFTPMTCAFLGAYFFTIQVVLLGYVRGDLRPKTYNVVAVRILVAVILAWMLQGLFGHNDWVLAASFLGGIVPDTVLRQIRDVPTRISNTGTQIMVRRSGRTSGRDEFEDRSPLLDLDGIGIYERTRLAEEGITSIQALARHDLVDLMLSSRIPASRLIDWLDQSLLYQHVTATDRQQLRNAGVRTATELIGATRTRETRARVSQQLHDESNRLPMILAALSDDEWLTCITHWRSHDDTLEPGRTIYADTGLQPQASVQIPRSGCAGHESPVQTPRPRLDHPPGRRPSRIRLTSVLTRWRSNPT